MTRSVVLDGFVAGLAYEPEPDCPYYGEKLERSWQLGYRAGRHLAELIDAESPLEGEVVEPERVALSHA